MTRPHSEMQHRRAVETMVDEVLRAHRLEYRVVSILEPAPNVLVVHLADRSTPAAKTLQICLRNTKAMDDDTIRRELTQEILKTTAAARGGSASDPDPRD